MAKFLNRKQQVYDLKLTNYGHYLLSVGKLEPVYYAFMDDNIIYDGASAGITETQNQIVHRIRDESQYIESLVLFEDPDNQLSTNDSATLTDESGAEIDTFYYELDVTPMRIEPRADSFVYTAIIGDAYLEGDTQVAPAWKMVTLDGTITSSSIEDVKNNLPIPQVNVDVTYIKEIKDYTTDPLLLEQDFREVLNTTPPFRDNRVITLSRGDVMIYGEEANTQLLTENFEIEVFEVLVDDYQRCGTCPKQDRFKRKFFSNDNKSIEGGMMTVVEGQEGLMTAVLDDGRPTSSLSDSPNTDSVSYYFEVLVDEQVSHKKACKLAQEFNKDSYYIDLGFECKRAKTTDPISPDIYGKVTEPEICQ